MRLKHIPRADTEIFYNKQVVSNPELLKGRWSSEKKLFLELGMGKGRFIYRNAAKNPGILYVGIEKYTSVILRALETNPVDECDNLKFVCMDAVNICDIFEKGEVSRIYLNFSDPWPKKRHEKRRLTSPFFLKRYETILDESGTVEFKTDSVALFDYSLNTFTECGWKILLSTKDLHNSRFSDGNVMTEYEEKFRDIGKKICKLTAKRPGGKD